MFSGLIGEYEHWADSWLLSIFENLRAKVVGVGPRALSYLFFSYHIIFAKNTHFSIILNYRLRIVVILMVYWSFLLLAYKINFEESTARLFLTEWAIFKLFSKQTSAFMCLQYKSFENCGKRITIALNEQFLHFPTLFSFLLFQRTLYHFNQIWDCYLQTLSPWKSLKFVVWKRVKIF